MNTSLFYIKTVMVFLLIACMGNAKASNFADLVPDNTATHTAIASGNWSNASIWNTGTVPNEAAIVIIPNGIDVNYNVDSEEHIFILRNDGHLSIKATNGKTRTLVVDTYLNSMGSTLNIDASQPTDGTIEIRFKAFNIEQKKRGEIDGATWSSEAISHYSDNKPVYGRNEVLRDGAGVWGRYAWDPDQATLGFMSAGVVTIEGKEKTPFLRTTKVTNVGVNKIELESIPSNWNVGDKVLLSGTTRAVYDEEHANGTEDEEFTITAIEGTEIALNKATVYRHQGIEEEGLYCHLSNLSRNVVFRSEGHGNVITKRGHVMFMMTTNVKVYNTQFKLSLIHI